MQIWWHTAEFHINFYQDPVGSFIEICSEGSCKPALAGCICRDGRGAMENLAGEILMALKE